jgi:nucleoside recognition membrane protein YjiH
MNLHALRTWAPILLGPLLFLAPIKSDNQWILPVAWLAKTLQAFLGPALSLLIVATLLVAGIASFIAHDLPRRLLGKSLVWQSVRLIGALFGVAYFLKLGPELFLSSDVGGLVFGELLPLLFCLFALAGFLLPLLLDYGLVEGIGTLMAPIMRPLFRLPGRSAIDCLSSWLGDGSLGVMVTARQYHRGDYTIREASVIASTFSLVSLTFTIVVITQLSLGHRFGLFYALVCLTSLACALILPRIPPLSLKPNITKSGGPPLADHEGPVTLALALERLLERRKRAPKFVSYLKHGFMQSLEMVLTLIPVVAAFGTIALVIAESTSLFHWLGTPFVFLLEILGLEDASIAASALVVGLADMFLPALMATPIESELTRLVVGVLSVSQLIYLSEVGAMIIATKLPLKLWELVVLFFLRTFISLFTLAPFLLLGVLT